jgi:hypothetical protein
MPVSPGRNNGSPPVNRISVTPSCSTATVISRMISASVSTSGFGSQGRPSGGMQ